MLTRRGAHTLICDPPKGAKGDSKVFKKIVVGYAGDQAGKDAVLLAAKLAALFASDWNVVFPYQPLLSTVPADTAEQRARDEVGTLTADIENLPAPTYHWTPSSWPIHGLHEMALYEGADLIVFGSAREKLSDHLHVSLMERMVHGAPCAVAVAPPHYAETAPAALARVGVGFSTSEEGVAALDRARALAARVGGRLEVIAGAGLEPALASYAYASPLLPDIEQEIYEETKATLERATAELGDDVPLLRETIRGEPADVLIERSGDLDILLLGSRAYGPLRHALMGSVSARVMREAHCPVLTVPRGVAREETPIAGRPGAGDRGPADR
jgi:nucleotide-binding universal stress UspA family protein